MTAELWTFAHCQTCEWAGPLREDPKDAERDAMDHDTEHHPTDEATWEQQQVDIGDDMYEQERYSEKPIDIVPDDDRWKPERPL